MSLRKVDNIVCHNSTTNARQEINLVAQGWKIKLQCAKDRKTYAKQIDEMSSMADRAELKDRSIVFSSNIDFYSFLSAKLFGDAVSFPVMLPHGYAVVESKPLKPRAKKAEPVFSEAFECKAGKYIQPRGWSSCSWQKEELPHNSWEKRKKIAKNKLKDVRHFRIMAFDFESRPSDSLPVIVCLTEKVGDEIKLVLEITGPDCHIDFLLALRNLLLSEPSHSRIVILGFNSSRFDNIFLAAAMNKVIGGIEFKYLESNGRIIDLTMQADKDRSLSFRDVLLYFPVGNRGSLRKMAKNFNLDMQKGDCTLEEMEYVGNLLLNEDPNVEDDPIYQKELEYCRQDTRVLYGLAEHAGGIFCSMPGPKKYYLESNPAVIPPLLCYLLWFITLPQLAIGFLPWVIPKFDVSQFYACVRIKDARFLKCSIYGGRTLCGTIGQILRNLCSTDICSEYPSAMNGPMPSGIPHYASLRWVNYTNRFLADDELFAENFPFCGKTRPFVAYVRFSKDRKRSVHNDKLGDHTAEQVLPFIPYRKMSHTFISDPTAPAPGGLEWLADTNGEELYGVYNCIDIYHMRRMGFKVQIVTSFRPICWPQWSDQLGILFSLLYVMKAQAKMKGDSKLELLVKILINSAIGKFAQRLTPNTSFDGVNFIKGGFSRNKVLYQLNSFCMAYSRLINQGHQSLICKGTHIPDYNWDLTDECFLNSPIYGDTDNLIFEARNVDKIIEAMKENDLYPSIKLCTFNRGMMFFNFTLEFEMWHKCPHASQENPPRSGGVFLGKKNYLLFCERCNEAEKERAEIMGESFDPMNVPDRTKAKGHNAQGIKSKDFLCLLNSSLHRNSLLPANANLDATETSRRLFLQVYPHLSYDEALKITSGKRFSFKVSLPKSGQIGLEPTHIERSYRAFIPDAQERCLVCYKLVHK